MKMLFKKAVALLLCFTVLGAVPVAVCAEDDTEMVTFEQLITDGGAKGAKVTKLEWSNWANNYYEAEKEGKKAAYTFANFNSNPATRANPGDKAKVTFSSPIALTGNEYLEFWVYSETFAPTGVILDYGGWITVNAAATADSWCFVSVPLNKGELKNIFLDYGTVKTANPDDNTLFRVYVSDMRLRRPLVRATAECTSAKMDDSGKTVISLIFSKPIEPATVSKEAFSISGFTCTNAAYSIDDNSVTLTFDGQLEFPMEYTLSIADTVTDSDGYAVAATPVVFTTDTFQSELAVKNLSADTSTAAQDGEVKVSAEASTIYRKNTDPLKFIAIAAVVKGESVLAIAESDEVTAVVRGESVSIPQLTIADESLKTLDGTEEIQMFLVSAEDGLMPLAEVISIN